MAESSNRGGQMFIQLLVIFFCAALFEVGAAESTSKELCANISNGVFLLYKTLVCAPLHYHAEIAKCLHEWVCLYDHLSISEH